MHEITRKLTYSTRHTCIQITSGGMKVTYTDRFYRGSPMHRLVQDGLDDKAIAFAMCAYLISSQRRQEGSDPTTLAAKFDRKSYSSTCTYLFPIK